MSRQYPPEDIFVLDANVLYGADLRSFLLHLAVEGAYIPRWSAAIEEEWMENLSRNRTDLKPINLQRTARLMNATFPEAMVDDYHPLLSSLVLPDQNDRHVLAVAIRTAATGVVTFNSQDFPDKVLEQHDLIRLSPDELLSRAFANDPSAVRRAFTQQVNSMKRPSVTPPELVQKLERAGLKTAERLLV